MDPRAVSGIDVLMIFVSSVLVAKLYVWPWLQRQEKDRALAVLVTPYTFLRFLGLSFLVPGVVSPSLAHGFAIPAAYGDFVAGVLAIVAVIALAKRAAVARAAVWVFNIWGTADFLYAFYQGGKIQLEPGALGAAFFIVTTIVPPLLVTHGLIFGQLVRDESTAVKAA